MWVGAGGRPCFSGLLFPVLSTLHLTPAVFRSSFTGQGLTQTLFLPGDL